MTSRFARSRSSCRRPAIRQRRDGRSIQILILLATGETLAQVQDRVLGGGVQSAPLFREVAGFVMVGFRSGVRLGRHEFIVDAENVTDKNDRGVSWGVDAPGRGISVRYLARF